MTGKYEGKISKNTVPSNVKLLGYLDDEKYWSLLASADVIMDLTKREKCLVCGAYEGLAVGKPLILSNTKTIMDYFSKGCIYVQQNPSDIAEGIKEFIKRKEILKKQIIELRNKLNKEFATQLQGFLSELEKISRSKRKNKRL